MAGKKFPYLTYYLSEKFVEFRTVRSLWDITFESLILFEFNTPEFRNKVIKFPCSNDEGLKKLWKEIENDANRRMAPFIPSKRLEDMEKAVQFIGSQIYSLFSKITKKDDRSLFLQYIAVNVSGTINFSNTVRDILEIGDYSNEWKFLFSCKYFAREETIKHYFNLLPSPVTQWCTKFRHVDCINHCYQLCFYHWHFGENTEFFKEHIERNANKTKFITDETYNAKVIKSSFEMALRNVNENGVQFIFENYISNSDEKNNILEKVFMGIQKNDFDIANIAIYFVSQMDDGELPSWFEDKIVFILGILFKDNRFHVALKKMVSDLENKLAEKRNLTSLLHHLMLILDGTIKSGLKKYAITGYRKTFMEVINSLSHDSRDCIFNLERAGFDKLLKSAFDKMEGIIAIQLLTFIITDPVRRNKEVLKYVTDRDSSNSFWTVPLSRYDTKFIEEVFSAFLQDENATDMRTWLYDLSAINLSLYFIINYKFENINSFIEWSQYADDQDIKYLKEKIKENLLSIVKTIVFGVEPFQQNEINIFFDKELCKTNTTTEEDPIKYIENILHWCLNGSWSVVNYKRYLHGYLETSFYEYIKNWVLDKKYDQLDKVFAWLSIWGIWANSSISIKRKLCTDFSIMETFCDKDLQDEYLCFIDRYYSVHWTFDNLLEMFGCMSTRRVRE